ncbi:MAG: NAD(P)H-hydrate dehydratase [Gammaproteobacteria bacterium RIFCSPHIGHO2_02_FULL_39_13]|nr:MAG: NAD(P)H-hydrate dehydratase [Gammaproteobacteria bacterium RIFCSPHIGHO2_02_FULL_39_13]OGT49202.1 MAG: NAD(P)H-hydrate dehydratase [Gammaproteobacteria bacterium RIFCSPHIGHO2_12_FULL_39_24]
MDAVYQKLDWQLLSQQFKKRDRSAHKGDFGHVLVVGGDVGMGGAVSMCAEAALRVGAGLVSVATHEEHIAAINAARPEVMCHAVSHATKLNSLIQKATVIVIGPGLGKRSWSRELFDAALKTEKPIVVDADALNLLSEHLRKNNQWILTPHAGEAGRLLQCTAEQVQCDRVGSIKKLSAQYGGVIVLKGAGTLIQFSDELPCLCEAGNPGMATAGMGDVLSGVIAGLLAQHFSLVNSAKTGVLLHAMAGDLAAKEKGERGMLATDLMPYLWKLVNP